MLQVHSALIRLSFLNQKPDGRKLNNFRLLSHDEMEDDGQTHRNQTKQNVAVYKSHDPSSPGPGECIHHTGTAPITILPLNSHDSQQLQKEFFTYQN